jgi:general secretion pathway protein G
MNVRWMLLGACLIVSGILVACSEESREKPGEVSEDRPAPGDDAAREKDLKELVGLYKEMLPLSDEHPPTEEGAKKLEELQEKATEIGARVTGVDPEKDADRFSKEIVKVMEEAAKEHDPEFLSRWTEKRNAAKRAQAESQLNTIMLAVAQYWAMTGRYPTEEEGLKPLVEGTGETPPSLAGEEELIDPWGNRIIYRFTPDGPGVLSKGPDGEQGTSDDIEMSE